MPAIIYRATALNGKCYIGQSVNSLAKRKRDHISAARRGTHNNKHFARALLKYGDKMKWEVIYRVPQERADEAERNAIIANNSLAPHGYNAREGGNTAPVSDETRRNMSASQKRRFSDPAELAQQSARRKGKKHTAKARKEMSKTRTGKKLPPRTAAHSAAISKGKKGKKRKPFTAKHRKNLAIANRRRAIRERQEKKTARATTA